MTTALPDFLGFLLIPGALIGFSEPLTDVDRLIKKINVLRVVRAVVFIEQLLRLKVEVFGLSEQPLFGFS